jgi:hypothetical protein
MIRKVYYWVVGHIIAFFMYDKKYLSSRYFKGRFAGISSPGWMWTVTDFRGRWMLGVNRGVKFPVSFANTINGFQNIIFDPDNLDIFRGRSKYFQAAKNGIPYGMKSFCARENNIRFILTPSIGFKPGIKVRWYRSSVHRALMNMIFLRIRGLSVFPRSRINGIL